MKAGVTDSIWLQHLDSMEMIQEMGWELHEKALCFQQIREAALHKTPVWPFTSHLINHSRKTKGMLGKQGWTH